MNPLLGFHPFCFYKIAVKSIKFTVMKNENVIYLTKNGKTDIAEIVRSVIKEELNQALIQKQNSNPIEDELVSFKEGLKILKKKSRKTLYNYLDKKLINKYFVNSTPYLKRSELLAIRDKKPTSIESK